MTRVRLPYLTRQRDHRDRWVYYYRRRPGAPKTRLPGQPGEPEHGMGLGRDDRVVALAARYISGDPPTWDEWISAYAEADLLAGMVISSFQPAGPGRAASSAFFLRQGIILDARLQSLFMPTVADQLVRLLVEAGEQRAAPAPVRELADA